MDRPKLPEDLKGQAWVAFGIPVGLAVLTRAAKEIEAGLKRRARMLVDLGQQIAAAGAELDALRAAVAAEHTPTMQSGPVAGPGGLCIAPGCTEHAAPGRWNCLEHDDRPLPASEVTAGQE